MTKEIKILLLTFLALVGGIVYLEVQKRNVDKPMEPFKEEVKLVKPEPIKVVMKDPNEVKPKVEPPKVQPVPAKLVIKPEQPTVKAVVTAKPSPAPVLAPEPIAKPLEKPQPNAAGANDNKNLSVDVLGAKTAVNVNSNIPKSYVVKKGDILTQVAERELGSIHFVAEIIEKNPELIPDRLLVGVELVMPERDILLKKAERLNDKIKHFQVEGGYEIKKGDNLYSICKEQLGSTKRVSEIIDLNPGLNPQALRVGDKIRLPK